MKGRGADSDAGLMAAAAALGEGRCVVVLDEDHVDGGGYLVASATRASPELVNFMASEARGLICLALTEERMKQLGIPMMVSEGPVARRHAFGASIEASDGVTTGISAADRARTILAASAPGAGPDDIVMPGHVFPIQVRPGGVLVKPGVPEAAVDLVELATDEPAAALCAVLDDEGAVATADDLETLAKRWGLPLVHVGQVVAHRLGRELVVERVAERTIESAYGGTFRAIVYRSEFDGDEHIALIAGRLDGDDPVTVRVHSQCLTGDVLGSTRCDCGDQLEYAMHLISSEGRGVLVYMHQEGRGIGLANKIRAYALQDRGRDTVEANLELGFDDDLRDYGITAQILKDLDIHQVRLLTNNPQKVAGLERYGVRVDERRPIEVPPRDDNIAYLRTKRSKLGHLFDERTLDRVGDSDS